MYVTDFAIQISNFAIEKYKVRKNYWSSDGKITKQYPRYGKSLGARLLGCLLR